MQGAISAENTPISGATGLRTAGAGFSNATELPAFEFADLASVAVPQEGGGRFSPPGGGAGSEDRGPLARRDPCLDKARGLYQVNMLAQLEEQIPLGSILVRTSALRSRKAGAGYLTRRLGFEVEPLW